MNLLLVRHLWGVTEPWESCFPTFRQKEYWGVESPIPEAAQRDRFRGLLGEHGLAFVPMIFTRGDTPEQNVESFRRQVDEAMAFSPKVINCHSGKDAWSDEDNLRFYEEVARIEEQTGAPVAHETHRKRTFFNPWSTRRILERVPAIRLSCDFSHWVCVCERLLEGCEEIIALAARHALHVHARVGYAEGPQVPDPRAPEWSAEVAAHERWWMAVWESQQARGMSEVTLTPEFGPPPYLHTLLHTNAPVADLCEICDWQARRQLGRFNARFW